MVGIIYLAQIVLSYELHQPLHATMLQVWILFPKDPLMLL